jgi:hypothetical protein
MSPGSLPERPPRYRDWPRQPYWSTFIEKLLLAIIDAHPSAKPPAGSTAAFKQREERLAAALEAIFNVNPQRGRNREYDLPALMEIASEKLRADSQAEFEKEVLHERGLTKRVSARAAARAAEHLARGNSVNARTDRLRSRLRDVELCEYLSQIAILGYHEEEEDMERDLQGVARILRRWNIDVEIDVRALGMASLWELNRGK